MPRRGAPADFASVVASARFVASPRVVASAHVLAFAYTAHTGL